MRISEWSSDVCTSDHVSGAGGGMGCRDKPGNDSGGALTGPEPLRVQAGGRGRGGGVASSQKTTLPGPLPTPESVAQMLEFQGLSALSRFSNDPSTQVKPQEPRSREMITRYPFPPATQTPTVEQH